MPRRVVGTFAQEERWRAVMLACHEQGLTLSEIGLLFGTFPDAYEPIDESELPSC
jgi:hypothetical protein